MRSAFGANQNIKNRECALVISSSQETIVFIKDVLSQQDLFTLFVNNEEQALSLILSKLISYVFIDADLVGKSGNNFIRSLRTHIGDRYIPIIVLVSPEDEELLSNCISEKCDDFLIKPFTSIALTARISTLGKIRELKEQYISCIDEQLVAKRILTGALDYRTTQLKEIKLLNRSKAILSGDLFITARHRDGSLNVLLADFTGHGLPAAIGALPVADIFTVMTEKGFELDKILENINTKLHALLPTSMFMACIVINITNNLKHARIWNGGMPDVYIRKKITGDIHHKIKSSHLPLGINETFSNRFELNTIDLMPGDELILYTDGLTEALNADGDMFGYNSLDHCLENNKYNESVFTAIVDAFNSFCGDVKPMDDITLACIPCNSSLMHRNDNIFNKNMKQADLDTDWCWYMELGGSSLREVNPVPIVLNEINKITGHSDSIEKLSNIMSILYNNILEQGALANPDNNLTEITFENKLIRKNMYDIFIRIGIRRVEHNGEPAVLVRMEDSARGVDNDELIRFLNINNNNNCTNSFNEGAPLVYELNKSSNNQGMGNRLEAIIC